MGNLSGVVIEIGSVVYYPRIDTKNVGFAIEEITVLKHAGPSKHPSGTFKIIWSFGDISFILAQEVGRERQYKVVMQHHCYSTIEECIAFLEAKRVEMIEFQKEKREQVLGEILEIQQMLNEAKKESLMISRFSTKKVAMLNQFDIRRDLEKRGLVW
jgi:hypothetical protein